MYADDRNHFRRISVFLHLYSYAARTMKLPFTTEQFMKVLEDYNLSVWPMQIVCNLLALLVIILPIRKNQKADNFISLILAFFWIWMGIMYHYAFFTTINKAAYVFAGIFVLQGILFFYIHFFKQGLSFRFSNDLYGLTGSLFMVYALIIYPVLGYFSGHIYPSSPTFGLPCPTTIFTFGILLWSGKKLPVVLLLIPLIWSVIGFSASFFLGILEDIGLIVSALLFLFLVIIRNHCCPVNN